MENGIVRALSKSGTHTFNKYNTESINLLKGLGVEGDAHSGKNVMHLYDKRKNPDKPNLRQVHLIHTELHAELAEQGFKVEAGEMGENITTSGIDVLNLPKGTILEIGKEAKVEVTGLRFPCSKLDTIQKGLMKAVLKKDEDGNLILKSGIMGIVLEGGVINVGDGIRVCLPEEPYVKLEKV